MLISKLFAFIFDLLIFAAISLLMLIADIVIFIFKIAVFIVEIGALEFGMRHADGG